MGKTGTPCNNSRTFSGCTSGDRLWGKGRVAPCHPAPRAKDKYLAQVLATHSAHATHHSHPQGGASIVEDLLVAQLAQKGGVDFVCYLLAQAVPQDESTVAPIREWTYKDILRLPEAQQKEWKTACREELEALHRHKVFKLVDLPKGRKLIKN